MTITDVFKELPKQEIHNDNHLVACGDSIELIKLLKDKSVDLIFADPPYNIGKDFGNNKDIWNSTDTYLEWCKKWIDDCFRILKDDGTFYFMAATQYMCYLDKYIQNKYNILSHIVWIYDSSGVQPKNNFGSLYEPIIMTTKFKNSKYVFNYKDILIDAPTGSKRKLIDYRKNPPQPYNTKKIPGNVWNFNRVRYLMEEYENHPTQKPEALLKRIILTSSNEGDIIFDPFGGSFTTSSVGVKLKRKTISFDLNEEYFKIGIRRTGLSNYYNNILLKKDKSRKTNNKSKRDHYIEDKK